MNRFLIPLLLPMLVLLFQRNLAAEVFFGKDIPQVTFAAAELNIDTSIWVYEGFWVPYLDTLARYRYNTLSLWTTHPYTHMVKTPE